jgi:hypothetical protein
MSNANRHPSQRSSSPSPPSLDGHLDHHHFRRLAPNPKITRLRMLPARSCLLLCAHGGLSARQGPLSKADIALVGRLAMVRSSRSRDATDRSRAVRTRRRDRPPLGADAISPRRSIRFDIRHKTARVDQVTGAEALGEFPVCRSQQVTSLGSAPLTPPQPREAHGGTELP